MTNVILLKCSMDLGWVGVGLFHVRCIAPMITPTSVWDVTQI